MGKMFSDFDYYLKECTKLAAANLFKGDGIEADIWMKNSNKNFKGLTPTQMVFKGEGQKVLKFLQEEK